MEPLKASGKAATLKEIAHIANVNISTVSRALNDSPLITRETREKVLAIAERMNYTPNSLAKGLVCQRSETIGIILPQIYFLQGPFFSQVLSGIEDVSVESGYNILIASAKGGQNGRDFPLDLIRAKRVDGVLVVNEYRNVRSLPLLKQAGCPFVMVNRVVDDPDVACVGADNTQGGYMAARHLIELGHRRIAAVTGKTNLASTHGRFQGYRRALEEAGMAFDRGLVEKGSYEQGVESGCEAMERLMKLSNPPTAVFAFSDELAMGVIQAAKNGGVAVPDDVSVIGYDNIEFSAHTHPPLTTVAQSPYDIGTRACRLLIDMLEGRHVNERQIRIPVTLVTRQSCRTAVAAGIGSDL